MGKRGRSAEPSAKGKAKAKAKAAVPKKGISEWVVTASATRPPEPSAKPSPSAKPKMGMARSTVKEEAADSEHDSQETTPCSPRVAPSPKVKTQPVTPKSRDRSRSAAKKPKAAKAKAKAKANAKAEAEVAEVEARCSHASAEAEEEENESLKAIAEAATVPATIPLGEGEGEDVPATSAEAAEVAPAATATAPDQTQNETETLTQTQEGEAPAPSQPGAMVVLLPEGEMDVDGDKPVNEWWNKPSSFSVIHHPKDGLVSKSVADEKEAAGAPSPEQLKINLLKGAQSSALVELPEPQTMPVPQPDPEAKPENEKNADSELVPAQQQLVAPPTDGSAANLTVAPPETLPEEAAVPADAEAQTEVSNGGVDGEAEAEGEKQKPPKPDEEKKEKEKDDNDDDYSMSVPSSIPVQVEVDPSIPPLALATYDLKKLPTDLMDESMEGVLENELARARLHPLFQEHCKKEVAAIMGGGMADYETCEWTFGDFEGDAVEDLVAWIRFLREKGAATDNPDADADADAQPNQKQQEEEKREPEKDKKKPKVLDSEHESPESCPTHCPRGQTWALDPTGRCCVDLAAKVAEAALRNYPDPDDIPQSAADVSQT